jgi:hypothetical protein
MKLIRLGLISIVVLFALASFVGALMPSTVLVSRALNVNITKDSVKQYLSSINEWKLWIDGMDNASVKILSPFKADLAGTAVEITQVTDSTVISSWTSSKGSHQTSMMRLIGDTAQKITVIQWQFEQKLKWYPWEKLGSMMNDKILGTMMEKNLNNLKGLLDKK